MQPEDEPAPASTGAEFGSQVAELVPGEKAGGGRYTLLKFLGQGGMGIVWLAKDEQLQAEVALKFLPKEIHHDVEALDDMRRETLKSRKLSHPNIIRIHDLHVLPNESPFISMEYIEGAPLNVLKTKQPQRFFAWDFLEPIIRQLCDALSYAHGEKVIHRDLKPANMMLDSRGRLKLADFGIAAVMSESMSRVSLKHATSGTLAYMSPQQMNGQKPEPADDIYALGATIYELLTSKPPFFQGDVVNQVQHVEPKAMVDRLADLELANEIPPAVSALVMACLNKDSAQRPQSAGAVAERIALTPAKQPTGSVLATPVIPSASPLPEAVADAGESANPSRKADRWIGIGIVALLVSGLLWIANREQGDPAKSEAHSTDGQGGSNAGPTTSARSLSSENYALSFSNGGRVTMKSLTISLTQPLTIEGFVTPTNRKDDQVPFCAIDLVSIGHGGGSWWMWIGNLEKHEVVRSRVRAIPGHRTHLAIVFDGQQFRLYVDGKQAALNPGSVRVINALKTTSVPFELGYKFNGTIDEVRVSKTIRYTKDFTPQARFTPDSDTLGLYHCDEGIGNELKDSSGNGHHGKITGVNWVKP